VSEFVSRMQEMVIKAVASIEQDNKTAEGYANRPRRDFQFGLGDGALYQVLHTRGIQRPKTEISSQVRSSL
jgi:hypothetical protein